MRTGTYTVRAVDVGSNGVLVNTAVASGQTSIGQQVGSNQSTGQINVFTDVGVTKIVDNISPLLTTMELDSDFTISRSIDSSRRRSKARR